MSAFHRSSLSITLSVWRALFLREAITRLASGRAAWLWIMLEPIFHISYHMVLFGAIYHRLVAGVEGAMFVMTGLVAFILARNAAIRGMDAINANSALFAYRQVLPVDTVIVRAVLEGFIYTVSTLVLLAGAALLGYKIIPAEPIAALAAFFGCWLLGFGLGLLFSVASELIPEVSNLVKMLFRVLYIVSGVSLPAMAVPQPYRAWLLYNPLLQGAELARVAYFPQFHTDPQVSYFYLYSWAVATMLLGLILHVRFAKRLAAQ